MDKRNPNTSGEHPTALGTVRRASHITLPREIRQAAHLEEGDYVEAEVTASGILLRPVSFGSREPAPQQEAEILAVVNKERRNYAAQRRR